MGFALDGKVAIVTGATSGIGAACATALAAEGARVAVVGRRQARLKELYESKPAFLLLPGDVRDCEACERVVTSTSEWAGRIDILVNAAGLSLGRPLNVSTHHDFQVMLETNVLALANLTRLSAPLLRKSQGDIVNISSVAARVASPGSSMYAASKAAVSAFAESVRQELLSDQVRMTTLLPGVVETEFFDQIEDEQMRLALGQFVSSLDPLKAHDIAEVLVFAVTRPRHVSLNEIVIRPTRQMP